MIPVKITAWQKGCDTVTAIKAIRDKAAIPLNEAHALVNRVLGNGEVWIEVPARASAIELVKELAAVGMVAELAPDGDAQLRSNEAVRAGKRVTD